MASSSLSNPQQQQSSSSMSSPPSRLVWFLLLDSATGLPYKGTTADKVAVSSSADVADFRKAVQLEYDKPNYLKDIPSGALLLSSFPSSTAASLLSKAALFSKTGFLRNNQ
jgi:hypothetical protein